MLRENTAHTVAVGINTIPDIVRSLVYLDMEVGSVVVGSIKFR